MSILRVRPATASTTGRPRGPLGVPVAASAPSTPNAGTPSAVHPASTMDCHPVQRQRWASSADSTACRVTALFRVLEGSQPHENPRGAEAALARSGREEGADPAGFEIGLQALDGGDSSTGDPTDGGDARHAGGAVHPDRAAPALALGTASVLDRTAPQLFPERVKKGRPVVVVDHDGGAIEGKGNG